MSKKLKGPKILFLDIETAPMLGFIWSLWDQNVGLNQIEKDWYILSWAAKWEHEKRVMYEDQSKANDIENDKDLMKKLWKVLDEADIVVTHNGIKFDHKKINARMIQHGLTPPSPYETIDTLKIAKKHFAFTSNKLEYLCSQLNKKYQKLTSNQREYVGFYLWKACMNGVKKAWREMKHYNKLDVLALEELYGLLAPWEARINRLKYHDEILHACNNCGSENIKKNGTAYTSRGRYQRYKCHDCGAHFRDNKNHLSKAKRQSMLYKAK